MKQMECDLVVIAAGPAGLAATVAAAEKEAKVIVLEKANTTGGASNMGMGPLGVETRIQRENLIGLTRELGMRAVAEGAEDLETLRRLREVGCDRLQGFAVARPMPADEIPDWIAGVPARADDIA